MPIEISARTPLAGRASELADLTDAVDLDGAGATAANVLLAGDAGVGKTRLLSELRHRARDRDWQVLLGHCLDFGDSALAYLPFSEMFGRLSGIDPERVESLAKSHPDVRRLLPGERRRGGSTDDAPDDVDRGDLFAAVHAALEDLSDTAPLLVVVEDAHWADRSTRDLIRFLLTRGFQGPIAMVVSYRSDDLHRRHPLRPAVAEWGRLPYVTRFGVHPLPDADVRELIRSIQPARLVEAALHTIVERAEGNAFFAEELVGAAARGDQEVPGDLADLLLVRLDQLDEPTRTVVRAAAAAGRRVPHALLSKVVDLDAATLDASVRSAIEGHILVHVGDDIYAFRHTLLAEAVCDDLVPGESVRIHRAYVAALQEPGTEGTAAEIARHARLAHDTATAIAASIEAGAEAMAVGGPDEGATHYELALEMAVGSAAPADPPVDLVNLTRKTARAVTAAGHSHRALSLVQEMLRCPDVASGGPERAGLLQALAAAALVADTEVDPLEASTEALSLVDAGEESKLRARIMSTHALANAMHARYDEAARWAAEAAALAEHVGLPAVVAEANTTLGRIRERMGDPEGSRRWYTEVIQQARHDGDAASELRGLHHLAALDLELGHLPEALAGYRRGAVRAVELGRPWAPFGFDARLIAGVVAYMSGEWDLAVEVADVTDQSPPELAEALLLAMRLQVSAGRGETEAVSMIDYLRHWWSQDALIAIMSGAGAVDLLGDAGDLEAALAVHDDAVSSVVDLWQNPRFHARIRLHALALGQIAAALPRIAAADRGAVVARADALAVAALESVVAHDSRHRLGPEGTAWVARVRAEQARVHWVAGIDPPSEEALVTAWQHAVDEFDALGVDFEGARSRVRLAAALQAVGRRPQARPLLDAARQTAHRLGAAPLLTEIRGLGRTRAPIRGSRREEPLTAREQEVLALVAEGRTNGEIAARLYISTKTVSVHVSNILAKTGAARRTEAAALARDRGLLPE